ETRALVAGALGADPSPELVDLVHDSAGGNPLFTLESMYSIPWSTADEGRGSTDVGSRTAGASLIDRFFPQTGPVLDVALVLSVLTHIPLRHLPLVAASTALDDATVSQCFDQLVAKQVLVLRDDGFEFAHS